MFTPFSELSIYSVIRAREISTEHPRTPLNDGHLLLALSANKAGTAASALTDCTIAFEQLQDQFNNLTVSTSSGVDSQLHSFSAVQALHNAFMHKRKSRHESILTGHLLLGILDLESGIARQMCRGVGIGASDLQSQTARLLADSRLQLAEETLPSHICLPSDTYQRLSDDALLVLTFAEQECRRSGSSFVGTEHLLVGVLTVDPVGSAKTLQNKDLTIEAVRSEIENAGIGRQGWMTHQTAFTPRAIAVIKASIERKETAQATDVLRSIIEIDKGTAARILRRLGNAS